VIEKMALSREHLDIIDERHIPKHVIVLAVDAFKYEYLKKYELPNMGSLITNGVSFANAIASNCVAETAPGFASISTGKYMKHHGICVSSCWYDRKTKKLSYFYDEVSGKLHLEAPTIGEMIKLQDPSARIASISAKDRNAFLLGGSGADIVVFSYREQMHERGHFTGPGVGEDFFGWTERPGRGLPSYLADLRVPRIVDWDGPGFHHPKENAANTPFMDEFIMEGALKILENERPTLLFVGLVSPNIVGHTYMTESVELRESCEVVDQLLGMLISRLKEMGWFDDTLIIFTADHGMADKPLSIDLIGELKLKGRRDLVENIAYLSKGPAVGGLYLHDISQPLSDETIEAVKGIEHIKGAWYKDDPDAPWFIRRGAHERAPDIMVIPEFRYQIVPEGRTEPVYPAYHGAPYFADFSIVMIFSGCGIKRMGTIGKDDIPPDELLSDEIVQGLPEQTQIVPTIKRILKMTP
jgi:predicted AlkP superfamily pyrophosphatase or phosphodiesterase